MTLHVTVYEVRAGDVLGMVMVAEVGKVREVNLHPSIQKQLYGSAER